MRTLLRVSRVAALLAATLSLPLVAQGWIDPIRPLPPNSNGRIERLRSAVQVSITGRVARVSVEVWFRNNGPMLEEGMYHFPLPGEAVFSSYSLWQGDQELRGEAMDASQARAIYEAIVRQKRDPALIELAGQGLIRARVFPINPGETRKITLKSRSCSTGRAMRGASATSAIAIGKLRPAASAWRSTAPPSSAIHIPRRIRCKSRGATIAST